MMSRHNSEVDKDLSMKLQERSSQVKEVATSF